MTDNIFDRLMELLQSTGPVNWKLAGEMAGSIAGASPAIDAGRADEMTELTRAAQLHVAAASGLELEPGLVDVQVVDRVGWARANLRSYRYLIEPIAAKMAEGAGAAGPLEAILQPLGPAILGMQVGSMVGFMSQRVLGQFDVGLPAADGATLYYVMPNIAAFAADHSLDPGQTRLWVAMHEVTHQAQFAVPWMRPHFLELVAAHLDGLDFDPSRIAARLEQLEDPAELEAMFSDPAAVAGLVAGPEQARQLEHIQAFMAFVEGYADYLMDRAAPRLIPDAARLREAMARRRAEPSQGERVLAQLLGLELKRQQYRLGSEFCAQVADRWGEEGLARAWDDPAHLPTLSELEDVVGWAARVLVGDELLADGEA